MRARHAVPLVVIAILAGASPAQAAEVRVTVPCVIVDPMEGPAVPIAGTGFTPGTQATIFTDGHAASPVAVGQDGSVSFVLIALVGLFSADHTGELRVTDEAGVTAATTFRMVERVVDLPARSAVGRAVTLMAKGYPVGRTVRLFLSYRGRVRRTISLGTAASPCGETAARRAVLLRRRDPDGSWRLSVGASADPSDAIELYRVRKRAGRVSVRSSG